MNRSMAATIKPLLADSHSRTIASTHLSPMSPPVALKTICRSSASSPPVNLPPLDPSFYNVNEEESSFLKYQTGIKDDLELKRHILEVQTEAYAVHPYPCIRGFDFTSLRVSKHPAYKAILTIGIQRPHAILLDLGCCFGSDIRKIISDGFPLQNVIASDIYPEFWTLGHKLFKTTQADFSVTFVPGDIFDPTFLSPESPPISATISTPPSLATLSSLTPLKHHVTVIHVSYLFHLFSESQQNALAHLLGTLLSPFPGSMIFGSHMGAPDTEDNKAGDTRTTFSGYNWFAHSPTSWNSLWAGKEGIFKPDEVKLETEARELEGKYISQTIGCPTQPCQLVWCITKT